MGLQAIRACILMPWTNHVKQTNKLTWQIPSGVASRAFPSGVGQMIEEDERMRKRSSLIPTRGWEPGYASADSVSLMERAYLRVRAVFHKTIRVCHVYCNFKIGFTCRITVIFGTLKDGSLLVNTLASNICFSYRNMFQNGVDALSKIVDAFLLKRSKFYLVWIIL